MASIVFAVAFPVAPLVLELSINGSISDQTMLISAIMYASAIAVQSSSVAVFAVGFVASLGLAVPYGISMAAGNVSPTVYNLAVITMIVFAIAHTFQRYEQHVILREDFLSFKGNE